MLESVSDLVIGVAGTVCFLMDRARVFLGENDMPLEP